MVSNDKRILDTTSDSAKRMIKIGSLADHLIIFILGADGNKINLSQSVEAVPFGRKLFAPFKILFLGGGLLSGGNNDLITAQDPFWAGLCGWILKKKTKAKLQFQIHVDFMSPYFRNESLLNFLRYHLALWLLPKADCLRVVSERIKKSLSDRFSNLKIKILPVFIEPNLFLKGGDEKLADRFNDCSPIILMVSRLTREKNFPASLRAFKQVVTKYPKALLLVVGEGPLRGYLFREAEILGLKNNVLIKPWTNGIGKYYQIADLFLLTSNYEGYGRSVVEAMIAGCPVIMTDVGVAGEIIKDGENGLVVPVGDEKKLAEKILMAIGNKDLASILSRNAKKVLEIIPTEDNYWSKYREAFHTCL